MKKLDPRRLALQAAWRAGAHSIEIDVQLTADGEPVLTTAQLRKLWPDKSLVPHDADIVEMRKRRASVVNGEIRKAAQAFGQLVLVRGIVGEQLQPVSRNVPDDEPPELPPNAELHVIDPGRAAIGFEIDAPFFRCRFDRPHRIDEAVAAAAGRIAPPRHGAARGDAMSDILQTILARKAEEVRVRSARVPLAELERASGRAGACTPST